MRAPCGFPATVLQTPSFPDTSHAAHCASHAVSQHTPSTQWPLAQSDVVAHVVPFAAAGTHMPALHTLGALQSVLVLQTVLHETVPHPYGAHAFGTSLHSPMPLQVDVWRSMPAEHEKLPHAAPDTG